MTNFFDFDTEIAESDDKFKDWLIHPVMWRDREGYVYWKGHSIEHYSFHNYEDMMGAAWRLYRRCLHLETINVTVTTSTAVWCWDWYKNMTTDEPLKLALLNYDWYEAHDRTSLIFRRFQSKQWFKFYNSQVWPVAPIEPDELGNWYHPMAKLGFGTPKCGQPSHNGMCYASLEGIRLCFLRYGLVRSDQLEG